MRFGAGCKSWGDSIKTEMTIFLCTAVLHGESGYESGNTDCSFQVIASPQWGLHANVSDNKKLL